jgi:hypothetical protein
MGRAIRLSCLSSRIALILAAVICTDPCLSGTWLEIPTPPGEPIRVLEAAESYLYAGTSSGLYRTPLTEPGSWEYLGLDGRYLTDLLVAGPDDSHILATAYYDTVLFRSTNSGETWEVLDMTPQATGGLLAWNGVFPGRVYFRIGEHVGSIDQFAAVTSTNFGDSWDLIWTCSDDCYVSYIEAPSNGSDFVYLGKWKFEFPSTYGDIHHKKSTDAGDTWSELSPIFESEGDEEAAVSPLDPDLLHVLETTVLYTWQGDDYQGQSYVGIWGDELKAPSWGDGALFVAGVRFDTEELEVVVSLDRGETWFPFGSGLPDDPSAWLVQFDTARIEPLLFFSDRDLGLWMREYNAASVEGATTAPDQCQWMSQGHPNPSAGHVHFRFHGVLGPDACADVFDPAGRRVRRLLPRTGAEYLTWDGRLTDGSQAGSGVYLIRVRNGTESIVRRVTVLR